MTILQINVVYDEKSTGRNCKEVERYLNSKGVKCITAFGTGSGCGENSYRIDTKIEYYVHNILSRLLGLEGYFSICATRRLISFIDSIKPDVIHLRSLHGHYLNLPILFNYLRKTQIPVVVNLHDCWIYTGKCTYPIRKNCSKYTGECKKCPARKDYPISWFFDFSKKMFRDKKRFFEGLNIVSIIGVSKWVAGQASQSFMKAYPISYIYNWIDDSIFHEYPDNRILDAYGIDAQKYKIICVAAAWKENSTKNTELIRLGQMLGSSVQIIVVGRNSDSINCPNAIHVGFISDTSVLAQLYSASDLYVHLSSADTFGKVIAEAMACGTPAIAYVCTACSELIQPDCGKLVQLHNVEMLYDAVCEMMKKKKTDYSRACIKRVKTDFDYITNCNKLLEVYQCKGINGDAK